jgi:signal transduction histidine kinase
MIHFETIHHLLLASYTVVYIVVLLHHVVPLTDRRLRKLHWLFTATIVVMLAYSWVDIYLHRATATIPSQAALVNRLSYVLSCLTCTLWLSLLGQLLAMPLRWILRMAWALLAVVGLLALYPPWFGTEIQPVFNSYSQSWYHSLSLRAPLYGISALYTLALVVTLLKGFLRWRHSPASDRLFLVAAACMVLMIVLDILTYMQLIVFVSTWSLGCVFFGVACSLRLGARALEVSRQLEEAHLELQQFHARALKMQRISSLGMIVRGIVHDLRNFFFVTGQNTELCQLSLAEEKLEEVQESLAAMRHAADEAQAYLRRMLAMTESAKTIELQPTALSPVVRMVVKVCGLQVQQPPIESVVDIPADVTVTTDPRILQQIVLNLTFNAMKALPTEGRRQLCYRYQVHDGAPCLIVEDSGSGLPPEIAQLLGETRASSHGFSAKGIGLRLVVEGCEQLGIRLVHSEVAEGPGTRFCLFFSGEDGSSGGGGTAKSNPGAGSGCFVISAGQY